MNFLHLNDLYKIYKEGDIETVALRGAGLTIGEGEFVAITGRSGAGGHPSSGSGAGEKVLPAC